MTLPIMLYGSYTCEDTAVTRDRLNALRVPFKERAKEDDESIVALLEKYNQGMARTPTLVFGEEEIVIAEPTFEQLQETLRDAGYSFAEPGLHRFDFKRYLPDFSSLPVIRADQNKREAAQTILFFAHAPNCRVCQGYVRQLAPHRVEFETIGVAMQIVLPANGEQAKKWVKEFAPGIDLVVDADGAFKRASMDCFPDTWDIRLGGTWLVLVDRAEVARAGAYAPDAGGLVSASARLRFLVEQNIK